MRLHMPFLLFVMLFLASCHSDITKYNNAFEIINVEKLPKTTGFTKIRITVENRSDLTFGCWADIKLKQANTIIERKSTVFSSLRPGESQIEEVWLNVQSHASYDFMEIELNWNVDSTGYSKNYRF